MCVHGRFSNIQSHIHNCDWIWETCIVHDHTSDFEYLEIYKNHSKWYVHRVEMLREIEEYVAST